MERRYVMQIAFILSALVIQSIAPSCCVDSNSFELVSKANNESYLNTSSNLNGGNLSISGTMFNDINGIGLKSRDDPVLSGWTIILKRDGKQYSQTTTDETGGYYFKNLEPGKYIVSESIEAGWTQTYPGSGSYRITLVNKDAYGYDFCNHYGSVSYVRTKYPIMSKDAWIVRSEDVKKLYEVEPYNESGLSRLQINFSYPASFSLLDYVPYIPTERDQGVCGNCWVWGCTAPIEVANNIQNGVFDRLSIQFLNSNYNGGTGSSWACCGGWEESFESFYSAQGKFIPWSNSNANYQDGTSECSDSTNVPSGSISTTPDYPITSIQWNLISTKSVGQEQAINNIKEVLNQNRAVTLAFYLPDFTPFWSFWAYDSGLWGPDQYCGIPNGQYPGAHEVTIVGYDDADPSNRYWIALNSWGISSAHPDGTYKIKMDMNYDCSNSGWYSYDFGYFDVTFENAPPNTPSLPSGPSSNSPGTCDSYSTSAIDPDGDQVKYTFDWGDGSTATSRLVDSGSSSSAAHIWSVAGNYQVMAKAIDSKGATSGWSDALTVTISGPNNPPYTPSIPSGPILGYAGTSYSYSTSAEDPDGDQVKYTFDWGDGSTPTETDLVNSGTTEAATHIWSADGTYSVKAMATDSKGTTSEWSDALTVTISGINYPPAAPSIPSGPISGIPGTSYSYSTSATDPDGDQVKYTFDWGDGSTPTETNLVDSGTTEAAAHIWSTDGTFSVKAMATDSKGATSGWCDALTVTISTPNDPPATPLMPSGPISGIPGTSYSYSTSAEDPDGDQVKYTFDWGDGSTQTETNLVDSGTTEAAAHIWSADGTYSIKAMATDSKGATSEWSDALTVTISTPNNPPATPSRPSGPQVGRKGFSYSYSTSATDPDGDQVKYTFDWGDGSSSETSLVNSGSTASSSHAWTSSGIYQVKAMATDSKDATSGWSSVLSVRII